MDALMECPESGWEARKHGWGDCKREVSQEKIDLGTRHGFDVTVER